MERVREDESGCIIEEPRELVTPDTISKKTLEEMDEAIKNFKKNTVSLPIDLSEADIPRKHIIPVFRQVPG